MILPGLKDSDKIILIIFLLALSVRLIYVLFIKQFPVTSDDLHYNIIAQNILNGNGFSYDSVNPTVARGPLYPLFLAAIYSISGYDYNIARILQAIIGAISCIFIYLIGKKLCNPIIGFYAALITSIYPALVGYCGLLYSETLAAFLLLLTILLYLVANEKNSLIFFAITGISCGLLILCYPKFLFLPFIFGFSIRFFNKVRRSFFKYFIGLIAGAVLILVPWSLRNFNAFGTFIPVATGAGTTLWYSTLPGDYTEWRFDREPLLSEFRGSFPAPSGVNGQQEFLFSVKTNDIFARKALSNIKENPLLFIRLSARRLLRQWLASNANSIYAFRETTGSYITNKDYGIFLLKVFFILLQVCMIIFACLGIFFDFRADKKNLFSPVFLSILYLSIINSIFMTQPRYQIPVLGLLFIYTALGYQRMVLRPSKRQRRP